MSKVKVKPFAFNEKDLPKDLKVDPFFISILSYDADKMYEFCLATLKVFGYKNIHNIWHPEDGFIFARGTMPVCLCAHLDKVPRYESIKTINKIPVITKKSNKIVDLRLMSKQGIGGDDRCGVYAILSMLKLGYRPSVLFCMGEEIGCRGSSNFCRNYDKEFLNYINAFIQIDRHGRDDVVCYSDSNDKLTKAISKFGYKKNYGSCSDISVLMPHFGISGVNLSSGYYHEHIASLEYVSVKDVKTLLKRLNEILKSDIFTQRYEYKRREFSFDSYLRPIAPIKPIANRSSFEQISLLPEYPYAENDDTYVCEHCGSVVPADDIVEVDSDEYTFVCSDCVDTLLQNGYRKCPSCGALSKPCKDGPSFTDGFCNLCGAQFDDD